MESDESKKKTDDKKEDNLEDKKSFTGIPEAEFVVFTVLHITHNLYDRLNL